MKATGFLIGLLVLVLAMQARANSASCDNLDVRLNALAYADQKIRHESDELEERPNASQQERDALMQRWSDIDSENLRQLKEIIAACGWPKEEKASHSAWLLAQHADKDIPFQHIARGLLENAVKAGTAAPRDLAYLADRIAANEGRPQEYGTQFMQTDRCTLTMLPVDNIELVKRRRQAIGLESLEEYAERGKRSLPPDCAN